MQAKDRILIVGAGIGGLAAAAGLSRAGKTVTVVERRPSRDAPGVGINQPANSLRVLRRLGLLDALLTQGYVYDRLQFFDRDGHHIVDAPSSLGGDVPPNCALSRKALSDALMTAAVDAGVTIVSGVEVSALDDDGASAGVEGHEQLGRFELAVAFDGMKSAIRRQLFGPELQPHFTGHAVWRVTVPRDPSVTCCQLFHGVDAKAGLIPTSADEMYLFLVTPEPDNPRHDPDRFPDLLVARLAEFGGVIGRIRDQMPPDAVIVYSPLHELIIEGDWHRGRILLAGDAAHLSAPHLTQGAAMALEDAALLVDVIAEGGPLDAVLASFARRRLPRVGLVQKVSGGILREEMSVTAENYAASLDGLRAIPAKLAAVEAVLNQPY